MARYVQNVYKKTRITTVSNHFQVFVHHNALSLTPIWNSQRLSNIDSKFGLLELNSAYLTSRRQ